MPRRARFVVGVAAFAVVAVVGALVFESRREPPLELAHFPRTSAVYAGTGAWVDAFDYAPAYQEGGADPPVAPSAVEEMAARGVRTLYIQAARNDERSPDRLVDADLLADFLVRAHLHRIRVVGWYLPTLEDVDADLEHLRAIDRFRAAGERFDGVAVDIEYTEGVARVAERNDRLVELSARLRAAVGTDALGAIVLPPVLIDVVNPDFWPRFPWRRLAPLYDVWLPMSYWTDRTSDSGFRDGFAYNAQNTTRLRAHLDDPDVLVHGIGGIGDAVDPESLAAFALSLQETDSIGGSIYDWSTLTPTNRERFSELLEEVDLAAPG
jgi:hypothetical protein